MGHTWRHDRAQRHQMEPLWKSLEAVEQDLLDMQAVHRYLRDRETRNRLCERSWPRPPLCRHASALTAGLSHMDAAHIRGLLRGQAVLRRAVRFGHGVCLPGK